MKKFEFLGKRLSKDNLKAIYGGNTEQREEVGNSCNVFCTSNSDCTDTCTSCNEMAGWPRKVCERPV